MDNFLEVIEKLKIENVGGSDEAILMEVINGLHEILSGKVDRIGNVYLRKFLDSHIIDLTIKARTISYRIAEAGNFNKLKVDTTKLRADDAVNCAHQNTNDIGAHRHQCIDCGAILNCCGK